MLALLYEDWEKVSVADLPAPTPDEGEVLLRVEACGICGSEIESVRSRSPRRKPPLVLGHEFSGTVEALGPNAGRFRPGDAVAANSVVPCGACALCRRGRPNLCKDRGLFGMTRPGACAEYVAVPEKVLLPRPKGLDATAAALAEPAANGVHVMNLAPSRPVGTAAVFGAGMIGLLAMQAARAMLGARTAIVDILPGRLEIARELGADLTVDASREDVLRTLADFSGEDGVDYAVDAAGAQATKRAAVESLRPGGAACWLGLGQDDISVSSFGITLPEKAVLGSYGATAEEFGAALRLLAQGALRGGRAAVAYPLAQAEQAFRDMADPKSGTVKAILLPQAGS